MASLCMGEDFSEELTCAVCLDSWKDPIELVPCGHIYCKECVTGMKECPTCREAIQSTRAPNRTLVNMALQIKVKCVKCGWKGTREQSEHHVCSSKMKPSATKHSTVNNNNNNNNNPNTNSWTNATSNMQAMPQGGGYQPQPPPQQQAQQPAYSYSMDNFPSYPQPSGVYLSGGPPPPSGANSNNFTPQISNNNYAQPSYGYNNNNNQNNYNYATNSNTSGNRPPQQQQQQQQGRRRYNVIEPTGNCPWTLYGIGQEEYDQIVSIFVFFDEDDSGTLEKKEVARLARWLNFSRTDSEVDRIFMDMDSDGNGSLTIGEFLTWLKYNKPNPQALYGLTQSQYNTIMLQFHMYDTDQDGQLQIYEFTRLVMNLGDVKSVEMAEKLFRLIDKDGDGRINIHEFLTFRADVRAFQDHQTRSALMAERERALDARRFAVQELRQKVAQQAKENQARQEQLVLERSRFAQKKAVQDEKVEAKEAHARAQQARMQQLAEEEDRLVATIAECEKAIQAATADLERRQALESSLRDARERMTQLKYQLEEKDGQVMKIETRLARMEMVTEKRHTALAERLPEHWLPRVVEADAATGLEGTAGESVLLVDEVTY